MTRPLLLVLALIVGTALLPACAPAPDLDPPPTANLDIPGMEERQRIRADLIARRLDTVLLEAMRNHEIDAWMTFSREHNLDPILSEIGGGWGGVRNAYIFFDRGEERPDKVFIGSHQLRDRTIPGIYDELIYYGYTPEGIRPHLRSVIEERDPQRIGINVSPTLPMADGLTWTLHNFLEESLGPELSSRLVSAELLIRDFRTNHIPEEWPVFSALCEWTVAWETEAFSDHVITVGETTMEDIHWWMRERTLQLGLANEFLPGVRVNRQGQNLPTNSPDHTIEPGDVLSVDAGLAFIDFRTDIKRTAYVLRPGEDGASREHQAGVRGREGGHQPADVPVGARGDRARGLRGHDGRAGGRRLRHRDRHGRRPAANADIGRGGDLFALGRELHARHRSEGGRQRAVRLRRPGGVSASAQRLVCGGAPREHADPGVGRRCAPDHDRGERRTHRRRCALLRSPPGGAAACAGRRSLTLGSAAAGFVTRTAGELLGWG